MANGEPGVSTGWSGLRWIETTCLTFAIAMLTLQVALIAANPKRYQWDFRAYYYATKAASLGLDPYDVEVHRRLTVAGTHIAIYHDFRYPPFVLIPFRIFGTPDFITAYYLFLGLKLAAIAMFFLLWFYLASSSALDGRIWVVGVFGFSGAIAADLRSGNIAVFEALAVLTALYVFLRQRDGLYVAIMTSIGCIKLLPLPLLGLVLFTKNPKRWLWFASGVMTSVAVLGVDAILEPSAFANFLAVNNWDTLCRGMINPSALALISDVMFLVSGRWDEGVRVAVYSFYSLFVGIIALVSTRALVNVGHMESGPSRALIALGIVSYGVVVPRNPQYQYCIFLVPAFLVLAYVRARSIKGLACLALVIPMYFVCRYAFHVVEVGPPRYFWPLPFEYWNWIVLLLVWILGVCETQWRIAEGRSRVCTTEKNVDKYLNSS